MSSIWSTKIIAAGFGVGNSIELNYDGERRLPGIDAGEASRILAAARQFLYLISTELNGKEVRTEVRIKSYKEGSDLFNFIVHVAAISAPVIGQIGDYLDLLKSCLELLRHLSGHPPKSIKYAEGGSVFVENNAGQINVFNQPTINLVLNSSLSKAAEAIVKDPLERGRAGLKIVVDGREAISIGRDEAEKFSEVPRDDVLHEHTYETYLTVRTAVLEGQGTWRFNDGARIVLAKIDDTRFLARVRQSEERFGHGDILRVRLRTVQRKEAGKLKSEYFIEEVLEHQSALDAGRQGDFGI